MTKLLRFIPLAELKTIRFICKNSVCKAVIEMPVERLGQLLQNGQCPVCHQNVCTDPKPMREPENPFAHLAQSLAELGSIAASKAEIEFVIPEEKEQAGGK